MPWTSSVAAATYRPASRKRRLRRQRLTALKTGRVTRRRSTVGGRRTLYYNVACNAGGLFDVDTGCKSLEEVLAFAKKLGLPETPLSEAGAAMGISARSFTTRVILATRDYTTWTGVTGEVRSASRNSNGLAPGSIHDKSGERYEICRRPTNCNVAGRYRSREIAPPGFRAPRLRRFGNDRLSRSADLRAVTPRKHAGPSVEIGTPPRTLSLGMRRGPSSPTSSRSASTSHPASLEE